MDRQTATLGGGCFWCLEAAFLRLNGVEGVVSGYAGGKVPNPTYRQVCDGNTGHAEVVQVTFDPDVITFRELLAVFFTIHDPTTINRQGADVGEQYRSVILHHDDPQRVEAQKMIAELEAEHVYGGPIVTQLAPLETFYLAEDYHQDYYRRNSSEGYCRAVIDPKLAKLRKVLAAKLKTPG